MFLAARIKLEPTLEQHNLLKDTLAQANQVCNWISQQAFTQGVFRQFGVHQLVYHVVRSVGMSLDPIVNRKLYSNVSSVVSLPMLTITQRSMCQRLLACSSTRRTRELHSYLQTPLLAILMG